MKLIKENLIEALSKSAPIGPVNDNPAKIATIAADLSTLAEKSPEVAQNILAGKTLSEVRKIRKELIIAADFINNKEIFRDNPLVELTSLEKHTAENAKKTTLGQEIVETLIEGKLPSFTPIAKKATEFTEKHLPGSATDWLKLITSMAAASVLMIDVCNASEKKISQDNSKNQSR